ncbi:MAG: hypothetical protein KDI13_06905 [Alphaproteobacteria bacterium]|nr:hypothetical protein [Alphaproteobacteria bacterium]
MAGHHVKIVDEGFIYWSRKNTGGAAGYFFDPTWHGLRTLHSKAAQVIASQTGAPVR